MNRSLVFDLATAAFIARHEDGLFLGPPGTGKSHLAQAIGQAAIQQGYRVFYRETHKLLDDLAEVVKSEDVDPGIVLVAGPVLEAVEDNEVVLGDSPLELDPLAGVLHGHPLEVVDERLRAIGNMRSPPEPFLSLPFGEWLFP